MYIFDFHLLVSVPNSVINTGRWCLDCHVHVHVYVHVQVHVYLVHVSIY